MLLSYQALGFYTKINYVLQDKLGLDVSFELEKDPKTYGKEEFELFDFGLRLFKLLTGEKRYEAVENFQIVKTDMRKIKRDEVSKLNPKVPEKLSEVIYNMTHQEKKERAQVFSELLVALREIH